MVNIKMALPGIQTLGQLKTSGYKSVSIKDEMRNNLIQFLKSGKSPFEGIFGFDDTVIPDIERAVLSRHNILLLGLRGQAKTRIARLMVNLLDEYIPVVKGSELNDDPLKPVSRYARELIAQHGDETPITWVHRNERYVEKLATPDVTVADLIGDIDPIKAASLKLHYNDERVIHFGLIPRSNRCIFVINELPDLQARIQVSLFNILQEGDIQIRGFKLRLHLDIEMVFTANPEDYTNRGSIITPLKDRIDSQILTHYPESIEVGMKITAQESKLTADQTTNIHIRPEIRRLIELVAYKARSSELIDEKSGISARLAISALENIVSTAERRMLINNEAGTDVRIGDIWGIIPSMTGKMELVYEGEQEGPYSVAQDIIDEAIKELFLDFFPNPEALKKAGEKDPYALIKRWFGQAYTIELLLSEPDAALKDKLLSVSGVQELLRAQKVDKKDETFFGELLLHGLAAFEVITKELIDNQITFSDQLADFLNDLNDN
ncbi:magnesium chelatase [Saprospiraceae bacterium]